jgi:hypothetical protein
MTSEQIQEEIDILLKTMYRDETKEAVEIEERLFELYTQFQIVKGKEEKAGKGGY